MSANVAITDTFDQWRTKNNELMVMTQSAGSSEFIKLNNTTNSTSNTTGSIITAGGIGIAKSAVVGGNLTVFGDVDIDGTLNMDAVDIDGAVQIDATLTVGVDGTGQDVIFYGAAAGALMMWDQSEDALLVRGATADHATTSAGRLVLQTNQAAVADGDVLGRLDFQAPNETGADALRVVASIYAEADATFDATTNNTELVFATASGDAVGERIRLTSDGKLGIGTATPASLLHVAGTVQVGVDGTGHDVKFFGATASAFMLWDEDEDDLVLSGVAALSIDTTTDASSTTTGSFHTDGGAGIAKKLYVGTDLDVDGTSNLDAVDIDGAVQIDATVSVGVDGTSANVKFFGATSSAYMLWQEDTDDLVLAGVAALSIDTTTDATNTTSGSFHTDGGVGIAKKLYVGTDLDVDGTTNLDAVDIDGAVQLDATFSVGVDATGYDVKFFGCTTGKYWLWDEDADGVVQVGSTIHAGTLTVGVDDTGHDVKFFGATVGAFMEWDENVDELELRGGAATPGKLLLSTAEATVVDGNKLGQIDFQAPAETGTDAIVVGASIIAEADADFTASVNSTDLVFLTADSGAATEKFRIDSTGVCTFADGAIDVDIASHDGTNGLKLGGTLVTATAAEINGAATIGKQIAMAIVFG